MRLRIIWLGLIAIGCSNDVDPRVVAGGGVSDGEIDGEINVHVIDNYTDAAIGNATVRVGSTEKTTDEKGLVTFEDVEGKQTVTIKAEGYRSSVWVGVNGANVTVPITPLEPVMPDSAQMTGTIAGWAQDLPMGHTKAAFVFYSQTDTLGDRANNIPTPNGGNLCFGLTMCNWRVNVRTGNLTIVAAIVDRDNKGTVPDSDDTNTVIGYAIKRDVVVANGINQSGFVLEPVEAGNLQDVTFDLGTPPAALPEQQVLLGIEISDDEVVQIPVFLSSDDTHVLAPKPAVFGASGYRLTAVAQTTAGDRGAQSIVLRTNQAGPTLSAGTWLSPPTGVMATRTNGSLETVEGALLHQLAWRDANNETILEITIFDGTRSIDVPSLVALPASGALTALGQAIAADFDVTDFSLETDGDLLTGISSEPVTIP